MMKSLAVALRKIAAAAPGTLRDMAGLAGVGLIAYGAWLIYPPAGFITGGALLVLGCLLVALSNKAS